MYEIKKLRADHVLDFAAEELKKYLRMMMPECGDVTISYDPEAKDGFRLGLLEDFGLENEAEDPVLDDVIHVDTTVDGGILAGSNSRSVLFAVYRYLRLNGCRWLYPGVDGDFVPVKDVEAQFYHKKADHRFRGHCNEGAESQSCMLETIEFYAKQELNVYMIEFNNPYFYYDSYYSHTNNSSNRSPEPVSREQVLQWKRQCETEIAKRGLMLHDMGHGWTAEPFGLDSSGGWVAKDVLLTPEQTEALAMINGKRGLRHGIALNTQLCMSNPRVRSTMVQGIAEYAEAHKNVTYLHVWLADSSHSQCECEECQKMIPTDYYLMIMNELDEELSRRRLDTRIVFIAYFDTLFAPEKVRIQNPRRFSLLYAPITRSYTASITEDTVIPKTVPYLRNRWESPRSAETSAAFLRDWKKAWDGPAFSYEYHYWRHQYMDPGSMYISRRIYEDIRSLKVMGLDGFVEDGSQRSFFPNGFAIYIYAEALMDRDCDFDAVLADYYSHVYGPDWEAVKSYLERVSAALDFGYIEGEKSSDPDYGSFFNPSMAPKMEAVEELAAEIRALAAKHTAMPTRPQTVSWRLLQYHAEYVEGIASFLLCKCKGDDTLAFQKWEAFFREFGRHEVAIERYYDQYLACASFHHCVHIRRPKNGLILQP